MFNLCDSRFFLYKNLYIIHFALFLKLFLYFLAVAASSSMVDIEGNIENLASENGVANINNLCKIPSHKEGRLKFIFAKYTSSTKHIYKICRCLPNNCKS